MDYKKVIVEQIWILITSLDLEITNLIMALSTKCDVVILYYFGNSYKEGCNEGKIMLLDILIQTT